MGKLMIWSRNHPLLVLFALGVISLFFGYHAKDIRRDTSVRGMMLEEDPGRAVYEKTIDTFGTDNLSLVYIEDRELFTYHKLSAIETVFYELQDIPGVLRVDGLFNTTNFKGEEGMLSTSPLLDWIPEDPEELAQIKADALRNPLLEKNLLSADGTTMAIVVMVAAGEEDLDVEVAVAIDRAIAPLSGQVDRVFQLGVPLVHQFIGEIIDRDQRTVGPFFFLVVLLVCVIGIRSWSGVLLPVLTGGMSILWVIGFMALCDIPINLLTWLVPFLVFFLGATEDMHLIAEYNAGLEHGKDRPGAIAYMAERSGLAVLLTGATTFLGFLSISVNEITMLRQFGIATAFAMLVNPLITYVSIPAALQLCGAKKRPSPAVAVAGKSSGAFMERLERVVTVLVEKHYKAICIGLLALAVVVGSGLWRLQVDNDLLGYFKKDSIIRVRNEQLHRKLSGMQNFYIVFDAQREGAFRQAEHLQALFAIQQHIEQRGSFDAAVSLAGYVALVNREMADGQPGHFVVPPQDELIAQYLLFFSRSEIDRYVSADFSQAAIHVRHNLSSANELRAALDELGEFIEEAFGGKGEFAFSGESILINNAIDSMVRGQVWSLSLILAIIFVIMTVVFLRVKAGLLAMLPNVIPIFFLFGIMGLAGIPLNTGTAMVAAISIGLAVDNTVHLFVRYNREMRRLNDQQEAVRTTIHAELRPLFTTAAALTLGFSLLLFSNVVTTIQFGLLSAMVMVLGLLAEVLITPILLSRTQLLTLWDLLGLQLTEKVIKQAPLFREMSPTQIKKIVLLGRLKEAAAGEYLVRRGERDRTMHLVLEGTVRVEYRKPESEPVVLKELAEGEVFGEIGLVDETGRTADVIAVGPVKILAVDWEALERVRRIFPRISTRLFLNLCRILGTRLAATSAQLAQIPLSCNEGTSQQAKG